MLFLGVCLQPPCVVTEYCQQGSLFDVLRKARKAPPYAERLTWPRRLLMLLDAAKGLLYLHSHTPAILHRDFKSPNLFSAFRFCFSICFLVCWGGVWCVRRRSSRQRVNPPKTHNSSPPPKQHNNTTHTNN